MVVVSPMGHTQAMALILPPQGHARSLLREEMQSRAAQAGTLEPGPSKGRACIPGPFGHRTWAGGH